MHIVILSVKTYTGNYTGKQYLSIMLIKTKNLHKNQDKRLHQPRKKLYQISNQIIS
ncbi:hypothetical protein B7P43_G16216 [Cryptotermes secundus]|uniref:Uncharacterized protein n=1 Tax=Cryptotermes secundus TaxID=105785 RepID=A0A2J7RTC8_9NEOP|nr:hypothetical protein B7P43_G16216 [Cryptotermes secundus]